MKPYMKQIILERMRILIGHAVSNARTDPALSQRQAMLARMLSSRHKIRMPYELRLVFCKRCKLFMAPGLGSRIRLGRSPTRAVRITCRNCGHTYRKLYD